MSGYIIVFVGASLAAMFAVLGNFRPRVALLSCPLAGGLLLYLAQIYNSLEALILAPVVILVTLLSILVVKPEPDLSSWPQEVAKLVFYILGVLGFLFFSFAIFGPYGFFFLAIAAMMVVRYNIISRDTTTTHVFSTIGASMRQNLPLATALASAAGGENRKRRRIMQRISQWLTRGYQLSDSLRHGYPKCPGYALAMVAAAERIQQVPQAVACIEAQLSEKSRETRKFQPVSLAYPLVLILVILSFMCGMAVFILPAFDNIYRDMQQPLPAITRWVFLISIEYFGWLFVLLAILILGAVPLALYLKFRPRRPDRAYVISRIGDFCKWHFPVLRWFERNFSLLQTVSFLRLSINAGSTVDQAIAGAAELDANVCYRRRLRDWLERLQGGQDIAQAARKSRVGSTLVWAFDQEVNRGNTPAILQSLESFYRSNYSYMSNLAKFIFWPCVSIVMGLLVGLVIYAIFAPMVGLIYHSIDTILP